MTALPARTIRRAQTEANTGRRIKKSANIRNRLPALGPGLQNSGVPTSKNDHLENWNSSTGFAHEHTGALQSTDLTTCCLKLRLRIQAEGRTPQAGFNCAESQVPHPVEIACRRR